MGVRGTALVTGASRGIGKGIALALARAGYDVAITARTVSEGDPTSVAPETGQSLPGSLATTAALIEAAGARAVLVTLDLLQLDTLAAAVDLAVEGLGGRLDVLVNNAIYVGPGSENLFADCSPDNLIKRVTGNITAQMLITQRALHFMLGAGGGTVCNVTSGAGQTTPRSPVGQGGWPLAYSVTKAGFHRIADMLVVEYGDRGIRAFNVNPGFVATERVVAAGAQLDFVAKHGISPSVIGTAIADLIDDPTVPNGGYVQALDRARALGLVGGDVMTYTIGETNQAALLPDPPAEDVRYTVISVDDHLVEPPDMFDGRLSAHLQDQAPRLIENERGHQVWEFDDRRFSQVGLNAVSGRISQSLEPARFEDMRRGCWDIHARIADMDLCGIWASLNFPSQVTGFCGRVFSTASDPELGLAVTQAWNDWLFDEWYSPYPQRIIPMGITFLADAHLGAAEIRRNAARGFTSVTLPERPHAIGFPSLFSGWWDPIIEACVETGTVVNLHVGSSGMYAMPAGAPELQLGATLFGQLSLSACAEWLWSGYPLRFPTLQIAMSEGGIGWVPMLIDRLRIMRVRNGYAGDWSTPPDEVLRRNFWFCTFDDPSTIDCRDVIGVDHIMVEVDYPHGDSIWPNVQRTIEDTWGHIPTDEVRKLCSLNAAALYRHPLPSVVLPRDRASNIDHCGDRA